MDGLTLQSNDLLIALLMAIIAGILGFPMIIVALIAYFNRIKKH